MLEDKYLIPRSKDSRKHLDAFVRGGAFTGKSEKAGVSLADCPAGCVYFVLVALVAGHFARTRTTFANLDRTFHVLLRARVRCLRLEAGEVPEADEVRIPSSFDSV
jgi:hypothetical protein